METQESNNTQGGDKKRTGFAWKLVVLVASLVVMGEAARTCDQDQCGGYIVWAVVCGVVSAVAATIMLILQQARPEMAMNEMLASGAFTLLWGVGVGTMTFVKPFASPAGNGYFSAWIAFLAAATALPQYVPPLMLTLEKAGANLLYITAASIVILIQAASDCDGSCSKTLVLVIVCSSTSLVVCISDFFLPAVPYKPQIIAVLLLALWGVTLQVTFAGPYKALGNGFIASWAGLVFSIYRAAAAAGFFPYLEKFDLVPKAEPRGDGSGAGGSSGLFPVVAFGMPPSTDGNSHPSSVPHPHAAPKPADHGHAAPSAPAPPPGAAIKGEQEPGSTKTTAEWHFWQKLTTKK